MTGKVKKEVEKLIKELNLHCSVKRFKDEVNWYNVSKYQKLSLKFIREFKDKVYWDRISDSQKLSLDFIREFKDKVDIELQQKTHKTKTLKQKLKEITNYAKTHNLKLDKNYLYAYRNHDQLGRGVFNKTIYYKKGKYYKDWHCDMNKNEENGFGLGVFPEGNTPVKVRIEDWGVAVNREDGKARVWGFEII